MREGKKSLIVGAAVLLSIVLLLAGGLYWKQGSAFTFLVTFEDAKKLQIGDPVYMKGLRIGDATDIALDPDTDKIKVKIRLKEEYKTYLRADSAFLIRKDKFILGKMCIEAVVLDKESSPIEKGMVVKGSDSHLEFYWNIIKSKVDLEEVQDILKDITETMEDTLSLERQSYDSRP